MKNDAPPAPGEPGYLRWLKNDQQRAARMERKYAALATGADRCYICGESDPHALEYNHIYGRANSAIGKVFCANCHRKFSDMQYDLPARTLTHEEKSPVDILIAIVYGLAFLIQQSAIFVAEQLRALGQWLADNRDSIILPGPPALEAN